MLSVDLVPSELQQNIVLCERSEVKVAWCLPGYHQSSITRDWLTFLSCVLSGECLLCCTERLCWGVFSVWQFELCWASLVSSSCLVLCHLVFPQARVLSVMKWSVQVHLITLSPKYILYQNSKLNKRFWSVFYYLPQGTGLMTNT